MNIEFDVYKQKLNECHPALEGLAESLNLTGMRNELERLHAMQEAPGFWDDPEKSQKIVVALSKSASGAALYARMKVVDNIQGKTLQQIVDQYFAPDTKVECDGYRSYLKLDGIQLEPKKYEVGDLHWLHKAISNLKTFLLGTYHGRCTKLQSYLDEFCFRFNRRMTGDQVFLRLVRAVATSCGVLS